MYLSKILRSSQKALTRAVQRGFADAHHHEHKAPISEITDAEFDKFRHLYPKPTQTESTLSAHNVVANNTLYIFLFLI
jgi:hypothetical protein